MRNVEFTMSADERAFLAAILARPDDDAPRLVFADWLDEHGEPERGEFLRVQCERHRIQLGGSAPAVLDADLKDRWEYLLSRERVLLTGANSRLWAGEPLSRAPRRSARPAYWPWEFRRGLVECVTAKAGDWLGDAPDILRRNPVREVRLSALAALTSRLLPGGGVEVEIDLPDRTRLHAAGPDAASAQVSLLEAMWPGIVFTPPGTPARRRLG